jgi:hypothetical protein
LPEIEPLERLLGMSAEMQRRFGLAVQ